MWALTKYCAERTHFTPNIPLKILLSLVTAAVAVATYTVVFAFAVVKLLDTQVLAHPATAGKAYALGGGEVLGYAEMVRRTLACLPARPRLLRVPAPLFKLALRLAHAGGRLQGMNAAALARMTEPLAFDIEPARRDFGYAPRAFDAEAAMFIAAPETAQA